MTERRRSGWDRVPTRIVVGVLLMPVFFVAVALGLWLLNVAASIVK